MTDDQCRWYCCTHWYKWSNWLCFSFLPFFSFFFLKHVVFRQYRCYAWSEVLPAEGLTCTLGGQEPEAKEMTIEINEGRKAFFKLRSSSNFIDFWKSFLAKIMQERSDNNPFSRTCMILFTLFNAGAPVRMRCAFSTWMTRWPSRTRYDPIPTARHVTLKKVHFKLVKFYDFVHKVTI